MKPCKLVLLGCGDFGTKRVKAALQLEAVEIVGLYDIQTEAAKDLAKLCPNAQILERFEDIDLLDYDGVILSTSNDSHLSLSLYFSEKNKYVLCESPLVKTNEQLEILRNLDHGQLGFICPANPIRYNPLIKEVERVLMENTIGKVYIVKVSLGHNISETKSCWQSNDSIASGGALLEIGPTIIGLSRIFGNIQKYEVKTKAFNPTLEVEDYAYGHFELDNNILLHFEADWNKWNNHETVIIEGERGILKTPLHSNKLLLTDKQGEVTTIFPQNDNDELSSELDNFARRVLDKESFFIDISEQVYYLPAILRKAP